MQGKNRKFRMNRKEFLKLGACSLCSLGLAAPAGSIAAQSLAPSDEALTARRGFMNPREASWFQNIDGSRIRCGLCPNDCLLEKGQRSLCRVRENREGKGYTLAYGNPALIQEDPVERKPFFHVLPGSRALSVSTAGCNLECRFCEVWDMALVKPEEVHAYDMPPRAVVNHARTSGLAAVSFAFGEPVIFYEYMADTARLSKEEGLINMVHTAGYIRPEPLKELCSLMDAANVDLKSFEPEFYRDVVGGEIKHVLDCLKTIRENKVHLEITSIVIPTLNDDPKLISRMCKWIVRELGPDVPLHLARFYPLYRLSGLPRTPVSTLDRARETALEAGLEFVYVARVTGHEGENTFCPDCREKIIHRVGFIIDEMHLNDGSCRFCGRKIPGIWG